ncbi:MAG TPA: DUF1501 domain-containing protein [Tepidisphaeraceae bacterium]|nr:DUF1501 domain-containing protein [Tepidisphaeraceae bacterium]
MSRRPQPMTEQEKEMTRRDFFRRAACAGVGMTAMYSTIRDLRLINAAVADGLDTGTDYRALVCIFFNGGNDSNNMLIPMEPGSSGYDGYAAARKDLAVPLASLLQLNPLTSDGHTYGLHPQCVELQQHFNAGRAAFVANVGTLVQPITRAQYLANPRVVKIPPQLFSHNDQVYQWMTSIPDQDSRTGWGGRLADLVNSVNASASNGQPVSMNISLAGVNTFEIGDVVNAYNCGTSGPIGVDTGSPTGINMASTGTGVHACFTSLNNLAANVTPAPPGAPQLNVYERAYADMTKRATDNFAAVNAAILRTSETSVAGGGSAWTWNWANAWRFNYPRASATFPGSGLMNQLKMVARLIAGSHLNSGDTNANNNLGHRRQIFFVSIGGYDLHDTQITVGTDGSGNPTYDATSGPHAKLFSEVSQALDHFRKALLQFEGKGWLASTDQVACFTVSDFGRTFPMNGTTGSDHGWGSHHIVYGAFGNPVIGQKIYGAFPTLAVNGPDDTQIGRWIPKISVDQYSATLAKWFGTSTTNLNTIFPNLYRFSPSDVGFMVPNAVSDSPAPQSQPIIIGGATQ